MDKRITYASVSIPLVPISKGDSPMPLIITAAVLAAPSFRIKTLPTMRTKQNS